MYFLINIHVFYMYSLRKIATDIRFEHAKNNISLYKTSTGHFNLIMSEILFFFDFKQMIETYHYKHSLDQHGNRLFILKILSYDVAWDLYDIKNNLYWAEFNELLEKYFKIKKKMCRKNNLFGIRPSITTNQLSSFRYGKRAANLQPGFRPKNSYRNELDFHKNLKF